MGFFYTISELSNLIIGEKMNKNNLIIAMGIAGSLLVSGCVTGSDGSSSTSTTDLSTIKTIDHIKFNLPQQVKWVSVKNAKNKDGRIMAEWVAKGYNSNNSPVRVVYQRSIPTSQPSALLGQMMQPLKKACTDIKMGNFTSKSKHTSQASSEAICAKMANTNFGTVSYTSVFADNAANHIVMSEVKTLPSEKAGVLTYKNDKQKKQIENTQALVGLMRGFMDTVRVCDAANKCM